MQKHSLTLAGHRTSVTLEPEFWAAFQVLARDLGVSVNELARRVDAERSGDVTLATALRLRVLAGLQERAQATSASGKRE